MPQGKQQGNTNGILRYSSMAFQMAITILAGVWLGKYLDRRLGLKTPWCTLTLSLFAVIIAVYNVVRDLSKVK